MRKMLTPISLPKADYSRCRSTNHNRREPQQRSRHLLYSPEEIIWPPPIFDILNLVSNPSNSHGKQWKIVGNITKHNVTLNTLRYIGGPSSEYASLVAGKHRFRVVTAIAPPFVRLATKLDNNTCLTGVFCLQVATNNKEELVRIFTDFRSRRLLERKSYNVSCCAGITIDLLNAVARDLHFEYDLYLVADGLFGVKRNGQWDGITADLVSGVAHLTFTAFSTTSTRVQAIDYSVPFFYSGVSCLSYSRYSDVPLSAFLIPFSVQLWVAIFASLHATAIAAAIYEWLSPFGLNPWGRQRTKNFSLASALWVMWSLLFSHLVAFKAPKSWPNKVLINLWGCFSVIFLATYTANIAAHFAGLFSNPEVNDFHDASLMKQATGTAKSSAAEGYLMEKYTELWHHIQKYRVHNFEEGLEHLRSKTLEVLIGDTAILDYFRATDPGCNLKLLGDSIFDDAYAVGMEKAFPLKEAISNLILDYNAYGFLDQLQRKWYGRVPCLEVNTLHKPKALTVRAVAGVFMMLCFGLLAGVLILLIEHIVFKYFLPTLRKKPKECVWKSPNLMFFSQKLYRFINTVELVSPHHSAKEIVSNLREGQIASLFQKSVKRKAKEEARRRKSKSQFFEMMQEVRKVVQQQRVERSFHEDSIEVVTTAMSSLPSKDESLLSDSIAVRPTAIRFKEPSDSFEEEIFIRREPIPPHQITVKPPSSLKSSNDSHKRLMKSERTSTASGSSAEGYYYRSLSTPSSIDSNGQRTIPPIQGAISISLDDVSLSDSSRYNAQPSQPRDSDISLRNPRTWSFDDLTLLKKQLHQPSPYDQANGNYECVPKRTTVIIPSPRHLSVIETLKIGSMSKEDIISMWKSSERDLLNQLQDVLQQKRALEEKVALLQRMLMKPP